MNVLSFFDGMSCGQIALFELGIKVDNYFASEIDKYAIIQTQHNFPNTIQLGSVTDVHANYLPKIDLFIGGSPCQGFSFAGKQLNFNDHRSALFFEYVRMLNELREINPDVKFLLENVNMKKEYLRIISEYLGVFPVRINSNLVSAQNRDRWYWTNIKTKETGLFSELWSDIPQPEDKGILLKDILESDVAEKYFMSDQVYSRLTGIGKKETNVEDKAKCITVAGGHGQGNNSDINFFCIAMRGSNHENQSDRKTGSPTEQRLEPKTDGKTNCLTSVAKYNLIMTSNYLQIIGNGFDSDNRFWKEDGKHAACVTSGSDKTGVITQSRIRRLTPTECARLQTIPDWYKWIVSDTQQYRMLGNGWTVEVIKHIFSFL